MHRLPPPDLNLIDNQNESVSQFDSNLKIDIDRLKETSEFINYTSRIKLNSSSIIRICDPRDMFCMVRE